MDAAARYNVNSLGRTDRQPIVFAHGFGCDQHMWRHVAPRFADDFHVVLFDHVGAGGSDPLAYDDRRHSTLSGYAADVLEICSALDLHDVVFVGHSVSAMIGAASFCRSDPALAAKFARVTFLSDNRSDLRNVAVPTLVLQCSDDVIGPVEVGRYVAGAVPQGRMVLVDATGHCPQLSHPGATAAAIADFVHRTT